MIGSSISNASIFNHKTSLQSLSTSPDLSQNNVQSVFSRASVFAATIDQNINSSSGVSYIPSSNPTSSDSQTYERLKPSVISSSSDSELDLYREKAVREVEQKIESLEQDQISELAARDREVRAHEQAHAAVGGAYAGAPSYQYEQGPDGVNYAVAGEVPIDVSRAATAEETIRKAQVIQRAALAPAEPSPQDRAVAAQAAQMELQAQAELVQSREIQASDNRVKDEEQVFNEDIGAVVSTSSDQPDTNTADKPIARYEQVSKVGAITSNENSASTSSILSIIV